MNKTMSVHPALLRRLLTVLIWAAWQTSAWAAVPALLNHQGRIAVNTVNFDGTGQFKFALVNGNGTISYWSNDGTSAAGSQPAAAVALTVTKGLYAVLLGDTSLTNMTAVPAAVFNNADVRLRVWFNDGVIGFQQITPDQRFAAAPYALVATKVEQVLISDILTPPARPVVAWGRNDAGQTTVPVLTGVAAVAAGTTQSLALLKNGTVIPWGTGPTVPPGLTGVTHIAAGTGHFLARKSDGSVVAWGANTYAQAPASTGITTATEVAAGEKHSLALLANGTVAAWGDNSFQQTTIPGTVVNITAIAAGYDHSLALTASGAVIAWGRNGNQQCDVPAGLTGVVAIGAGAYHSLAVKSDGTVTAWGLNRGGQTTVPDGLTGISKVAGGYTFSVALKTDGTLTAWGNNSYGQTILPAEGVNVTAIAAGEHHALALRADLIPGQVARRDQPNVFVPGVGIGRTAAVNALEVEGQASKTTASNWFANSDRRIKTDIAPLTGALEKLDQVRLVDFRYTEAYRAAHPGIADKHYLNVVAQEFAQVFPDHVQSSGEALPDGSPILQVDTYPLTIYSAAAVQELHRAMKARDEEIAALKQRLDRLEKLFLPSVP